MPITTSPVPRLTSAMLVISRPMPDAETVPALHAAALTVSRPLPTIAPVPALQSASLSVSRPIPKITPVPRLMAAMLSISQDGASSVPVGTSTAPMLKSAMLVISTAVLDYDATNRMTDPEFRKKDFTRSSDPKQLLTNQRATYNHISLGHSTTDGGHEAQDLSTFSGWARKTGLPNGSTAVTVGDTVIQSVDSPGPTLTQSYIPKANIGVSVPGVYESVIGFGGEQTWSVFVLMKRVQ